MKKVGGPRSLSHLPPTAAVPLHQCSGCQFLVFHFRPRYYSSASSFEALIESRLSLNRSATTPPVVSLSESKKVPHGYWADRSHHRELFDDLGSRLGIQQLSDWYAVTAKKLNKVPRGWSLLHRKKYYPSLKAALKTVYPEYPWQDELFHVQHKRFVGSWRDINKQKRFLESTAAALGITRLSGWYKISRKDVEQRGGFSLFAQFSSLQEALKTIYPEYPWDPNRFNEEGKKGRWKDTEVVWQALEKAGAKLGLKQPEDWYSVNMADLHQTGFPKAVTRPKVAKLLDQKYPGLEMHRLFTLKGRYSEQRRLERAVAAIFPDVQHEINARKTAQLINPETGYYLELDLYIPSLNIGFEYQDKHHYTTTEYNTRPMEHITERDKKKKELAASQGITLVIIPCWWDGTLESLAATIKKAAPHLIPPTLSIEPGDAIPEEIPPGFLNKYTFNVDDIGEPTTACFFTLSNVNPQNWWMFEKYDGVRGFWNPWKKEFYSRHGKKLEIPQKIVDSMPSDTFLDGELWFGRDQFRDALRMASKVASDSLDWAKFKYMVFDLPKHTGSYKERYEALETLLGNTDHPYMKLARKEVCLDMPHFEKFFQDVIDNGGEGVILRDPKALFQAGRDPGYLKHKKFRDAEAKVIGSAGSFSWECEMPNGIRFIASAGTSEFVKRWNPQPGDIVSFKHHGYLLASKKPKLPALYRLRSDLTWQDVVQNWKERKSAPMEPYVRRSKGVNKRPFGFWNNPANCRKFLEDFAWQRGFDPLVADNWRGISGLALRRFKGKGLLNGPGTIRAALEKAFPELTFDFPENRRGLHWRNINHCKAFFDDVAKEQGFDPLDVKAWQSFDLQQIEMKPGGRDISRNHGTLLTALKRSYPSLPL